MWKFACIILESNSSTKMNYYTPCHETFGHFRILCRIFFFYAKWLDTHGIGFFSLFSFQSSPKMYRPFHLPTRNIHSVKLLHWILFDAVVSNMMLKFIVHFIETKMQMDHLTNQKNRFEMRKVPHAQLLIWLNENIH